MKLTPNTIACDFCGKGQHEVLHLVIGAEPAKPAICDECVRMCVDALADADAEETIQ